MSRIITLNPRGRRIVRPVSFGLEGIIKSVEVIRNGVVRRRLGPYRNVITNGALDAIGNGTTIPNLANFLGVGTNNTAPSATDSALFSEVGTRTNDNGGFATTFTIGPSNAYHEREIVRQSNVGDMTGNLTELGLFSALAGGTMWMRQLFLAGGSPTTVTVQADEQLRVTYAWRVYPNTTIVTDSLTIDGVLTDCDNRAMRVNADAAWGSQGVVNHLGGWSTDPRNALAYETNTFPATDGGNFAGSFDQASTVTNAAYTPGNYYRDIDVIFEPAKANFPTGIGAVTVPYWGPFAGGGVAMATTLDPKVQKDNTERYTHTFRVSWGRR